MHSRVGQSRNDAAKSARPRATSPTSAPISTPNAAKMKTTIAAASRSVRRPNPPIAVLSAMSRCFPPKPNAERHGTPPCSPRLAGFRPRFSSNPDQPQPRVVLEAEVDGCANSVIATAHRLHKPHRRRGLTERRGFKRSAARVRSYAAAASSFRFLAIPFRRLSKDATNFSMPSRSSVATTSS
jgi:hypothetical protein